MEKKPNPNKPTWETEQRRKAAEAGCQSLAALEQLLGRSVADFNASGDTTLDLSGKGLTSVPEGLGQLHSLQTLHLYNNHLTSLPGVSGSYIRSKRYG